ncbi:MAG: DUF3291 domain-containing protein [Chloroflexota bacterium]
MNVARPRAPLGSAAMAGFVAALGPVNDLADSSPGFVWRLPSTESHGATTVEDDGSALVLNLSVWESYEALHAFVYRSPHGAYLRRRARWFSPVTPPWTALWWLPAGTHPTPDEALRRLRHLRAHGPSPQAFTLRRRFDPAGRARAPCGR